MADNVVGIKFGVSGGINGESAKLIQSQLSEIAKNINLQVKVNINKTHFKDQLASLKQELDKTLGNLKINVSANANASGKGSSSGEGDAKKQAASYESVTRALEKLYAMKVKLLKMPTTDGQYTSVDGAKAAHAVAEQEKAYKRLLSLLPNKTKEEQEQVELITKYNEELEKAYKTQQKSAGTTSPVNVAKLQTKAASLYVDNGFDEVIARSQQARELVNQFSMDLNDALNRSGGTLTEEQVKQLNTQFLNTQAQLKQIQKDTDTVGNKIKAAFSSRFIQRIAQVLLLSLARAFRQIYQNVVKIDTAMTQLKIVTNENSKAYERYAKTVADSARKIGASIADVINSTTTYARLGYSLTDAATLAELTTIYSNVGAIDVNEATTNITAILKAYNVGADGLESVLDKLIYVGNNYAISSSEIGEAMNNAASSLAANGNSLMQAIGILTAANATLQNVSKSSTAVRTITARISASTAELEELGEDSDGILATADLDAKMRAFGVAITDVNGNLRSTYDILADLAKKWGDLNNVQQAAIADMLAGTRQQNAFYSIMANWGDAESVAGGESRAEGSLGAAQAKYLDSIEGKLNQLTASWESFSQNILNSQLVSGGVQFLTTVVGWLDSIVTNVNMIGLAFAALSMLVGKFGTSLVSKLLSWIKGLATLKSSIATTKTELQKANQQLKGFFDAGKGGSNTADELNKIYESTKDNTDQMTIMTSQYGLSEENAKEFIALKRQEAAVTQNLTALEQQRHQAMMLAYTGGAAILLTVVSALSTIEGTGGKIVTLIAAAAAMIGVITVAIKLFFKTAENGARALSQAEKTSVILTALSIIIGLLMIFINVMKSLIKTDAELKEEAQESAKALQEEADALRDVADASKEACEGIRDLIGEFKELNDTMSNADWYDFLEDLGGKVNTIFADEELSSLQAINKLLGTAYNYSDLMRLSDEERLKLLDEIQTASLKATQEQQKNAYAAQKLASDATASAEGMRTKVKDWNSDSKGLVDSLDGLTRSGKKITINADSAKEFVDILQNAVDSFEDNYIYDGVYDYLVEELKKGKEALQQQVAAAIEYLDTAAAVEGLNIDVNLDAADLQLEYDRVLAELSKRLSEDDTIAGAINEGILDSTQISEYATKYIATYYKDLYNAVNKSVNGIVVKLKTMVDMLEEVENAYDTLNDAMEDMNKLGVLSVSTTKKMLEEFPELVKYLEKTADGYKLIDGALTEFMAATRASYLDQVTQAQEYFDKVYKEYEESEEKTVDGYRKVVNAQEQLNNAIENAKEWLITEAVLERSKLIDQYTDLLKEQIDYLEEQCDKYKDLCEIRRDLLSTYQEELDYQRELKQKQQSVADLQTQLALARLDNSAAGQARARELEAQLAEAQEELDEYTLDHAIEDLCNKIDEGYNEYEEFIQEQIEALEEVIANIISMSTSEIVAAIKATGSTPVVDGSGGSDSSTSNESYNSTVDSASSSASQTISEANTFESENVEEEPKKKITVLQGAWGEGIKSSKVGDNGTVHWNDKKYYIENGGDCRSDPDLSAAVSKANLGDRTIFGYDGQLFGILDGGIVKLRQRANSYKANSDKGYVALTNAVKAAYGTYHTGGFVGDMTQLRSNEEFAKLLKGELVVTPRQMDDFMKNTLPALRAGGAPSMIFNSPLLTLQTGNVTPEAMPELKEVVNEAVRQVEKKMHDALSRTSKKI